MEVIITHFPYFQKIKWDLWVHLAVCVSVSLNAARQRRSNTFLWRRIHTQNRKTVGRGVCYAVRVISNTRYVVNGNLAIRYSQNLFCLFVHHAIKPYGRMDIWLHTFLTSAVCGCKCLTPEEGPSGAHWIRGSLDPKTGLETAVYSKNATLSGKWSRIFRSTNQ